MTREISEAKIAFLLAMKRQVDFAHTIDFGKEYSLKLRNGGSPIARALAEPGARIDAILYLDDEEIDCSVRIVSIEHLEPKKVSRAVDSTASFRRSELQGSMAAGCRDEDSLSTADESSDSNEDSVVVQIDLPAGLQLLDAKVVDGELEAVGPANPSCTHAIFCNEPLELLKNIASAVAVRLCEDKQLTEKLSKLEEAANLPMPENSGRFKFYSYREFGEVLKSGDSEAWELWRKQYRGFSWSTARALKLEPDYDGDDVLPESFVKLFKWLDKDKVSEDNVYTPFISPTIIRTVALDLRKRLNADMRRGGKRAISLDAEIAGTDGKSLAATIPARSNGTLNDDLNDDLEISNLA